ncbi:MAG TPA: RNA polymerase factor sigma-54 [Hyphomicrobiaceae bacterium]|nr:RNA polymerase factor sigma-54 [Hyphomicrobiaceae bacterium]
MVLSPKLELRQGQQLVMTPQLQQAIRLLQLSNLELASFVEAELERNPLLERDETPTEAASAPQAEPDEPEGGGWSDDGDGTMPGDGANRPGEPRLGSADRNGADHDQGGWAALRPRTVNSYAGDGGSFDNVLATAGSLADHLTEQLNLAVHDPAKRLIGVHLIHMVDEAGYLLGDLDDLAARLGASRALIDAVLGILQQFDPPGVCARSLAECLALQLREQNRYDPQIAKLLAHLDLLGSHNLAGLKRSVDVDAQELADMIAEIRRLNPKPGLKFGTVAIQPVLPDVTVRAARDGSWVVELNSDTLPRVLVNRSYHAVVSKTAGSQRDRDYLADCLQNANWLVKSLDQRARTILRVAEEIVRQQDGFLSYGIEHLKPLNLKTVADAIAMHESTVSRVTSNKYVATPRGVFELKYFFTSAIASAAEGEAHSSEAVRHRIRQLIDAETAHSVLSDDKIVEHLKRDGIEIARRTVAKYRDALRIPSSVQRRREKQMAERLGAGV